MRYQTNDLDSLSQTHLVCQDPGDAIFVQTGKPSHTFQLVVLEGATFGEIRRLRKDRFRPRSDLGVLLEGRLECIPAVALGSFALRAALRALPFSFFGLFGFLACLVGHSGLQVFQVFRDKVAVFRGLGQQKVELVLPLMDDVAGVAAVGGTIVGGFFPFLFFFLDREVSLGQSRLEKPGSGLRILWLLVGMGCLFLFLLLFERGKQGVFLIGPLRLDRFVVIGIIAVVAASGRSSGLFFVLRFRIGA
mmetsp:Transcript_60389/g.123182  ORF Transcript_60389/g.123182 Transcript_60389/m.123182 type:complete len:248 (+) Transcript_60389:1717-2460(+)